jgi:GNAT superfamily N-acetyltransferase
VFSVNREISPTKLQRLYQQVPWARDRTIGKITAMMAGTYLHVSAWYGDELVAFGRALSDGVYRAILEDIIVDEQYRGRAIGTKMLHLLLAELRATEEVSLGCTDDVVSLDERFGFPVTTLPALRRTLER